MPPRRASRATDLERVVRILDGDVPDGAPRSADGRWVPGPPTTPGPAEPRGSSAPSRASGEDGDPGLMDELERLDLDLRRARRPAVLTVPEQLRAGRLAVSSAAVVGVLALLVALACVFVLRILWAERAADGTTHGDHAGTPTVVVASARTAAAHATASGVATSGRGVPGPGPPAGAEVVVHVVGQVLRPGLVRLRPGARVADALSGAGGAKSGADLSALNLARVVVDGEQVHVPKPGEAVPPPAVSTGADGRSVLPGGAVSGTSPAPVDLNAADVAALDTLPGVGPVLAQRIVDWRNEHGRFTSVDELGEVSGIGDKLMAQLRPLVRV